MALQIVDFQGNRVGEKPVPGSLQIGEINQHLIWEVVKAEQANKRQGTHATKTRGDVSGGGIKPWRQKGTGRARAGSNRSPVWRHGGTTFGPQPRDYREFIPRKKKKAGLQHIVAEKISQNKLILLKSVELGQPSTKTAFAAINKVITAAPFAEAYAHNRKMRAGSNDSHRTVTLVVAEDSSAVKLSLRNIPWVNLIHVDRLAALPVYQNHGLIFTEGAFETFASRYAN